MGVLMCAFPIWFFSCRKAFPFRFWLEYAAAPRTIPADEHFPRLFPIMDRRRCAGPASCADLVVMTPSPRSPSGDPLLQPYRLKHLTLRNRILSTAHEPAYSEDGLPKKRYRLYPAQKAKGRIELPQTRSAS